MASGDRIHHVTLQGPGAPVPDADGGWTSAYAPLNPPTWWCSIEPASARALERVTAGTTLTAASHLVEGEYHPQITTKTQIVKEDGRVLFVNSVVNPGERNINLILVCQEVVA